ncbi:CHAT domain-containing protein, partial [candidate division KSB1 bacterium]|nr:CHAT domain-containing protein [candidate division KSB1 bacterium]
MRKKYHGEIWIFLFVSVTMIAAHLYAESPNCDLPLDQLMALGEKFPDKGYLDQALFSLESVKNFWIQEILIEGLDHASRNELNEIIRYHNHLHEKLTFWQKTSNPPSDSIAIYEARIDSFKCRIIQTKPEYLFFLKVMQPQAIKVIQKDYLQDRQAILDYLVTEQHVYILVIARDTVAIVKCDATREFVCNSINRLLNPLAENKNLFHLTYDVQLAHEFYQKVFQPAEKIIKDVNAIIIIPDEVLLGFPFECLVTGLHSPKYKKQNQVFYDEFRDVSFLINKYAISYNYSLTALDQEFLNLRQNRKLNRKLLTMSEIKGTEDQADSTDIQWDRQSTIFGYEEVV